MGSSPLFQSGGRPADPPLSGNASTSPSRGEVTTKRIGRTSGGARG